MDILKEIDSTLHYENIEKAWKKHKFTFALGLVAIFAATAGYQGYTSYVEENAQNDSAIVYSVIIKKAESENYIQDIQDSFANLKTSYGKETMKFELAKAYKVDAKMAEYEATLTELTSAKTQGIKDLATFMLAEHFLATDANKALEFAKNVKISKKSFAYPFIQEVEAMAQTKLGNTADAKAIYTTILANTSISTDFKQRVEIKLKQLG